MEGNSFSFRIDWIPLTKFYGKLVYKVVPSGDVISVRAASGTLKTIEVALVVKYDCSRLLGCEYGQLTITGCQKGRKPAWCSKFKQKLRHKKLML